MRYVIEVRDETGWLDYSEHDDLAEAIAEAHALAPGFLGNCKLIDKQEMEEVSYG